MKEIAAGGVVYRKTNAGKLEIQLIMDRYGKITLAKGKMESGETVRQTALREIKEETGLDGRIIADLAVVQYQYQKGSQTVDKEVHYFLVEAVDGRLAPQFEEIQAAEWHEPMKAWQLQKAQGYANNDIVLIKALERLGQSRELLAGMIDHTQLKADAGYPDIEKLCREAMQYHFYSVCVNSSWVEACRRLLEGSEVKISAVCGFPLGAAAAEVKAREAAYSIEKGASEIDMVMQVGRLISGQEAEAGEDMKRVIDAVKQTKSDAVVKVILETGYLTEQQIRAACRIAEQSGADFVKTSTGFGPRGASEQDIVLMKDSVSDRVKIKAAGGIRDAETALRYIALGASRLGTSAGPAIMAGAQNEAAY